MANAKSFVEWFLSNIPTFLMSDPIIYFVGFGFLGFTIKLFRDLVNI